MEYKTFLEELLEKLEIALRSDNDYLLENSEIQVLLDFINKGGKEWK